MSEAAELPQLLLASPWPPAKSDIARHVSEILLPALQARYSVVPIGVEGAAPGSDSDSLTVLPVQSGLDRFPNAPLLAHLGNESLQNEAALAALTNRAGVVVLHDIVLHHAWYDACMRLDRFDGYLASVREFGGAAMAENALLARHHSAVVHRLARSVPLFEPFLSNALGVVVHSQMAFDAVSERGPWPVCRLDLPTPMPDSESAVLAHRASQAAELASGQTLRLAVFGYLGPNRCLPQILDAITLLKARNVPVRLDIFGRLSDAKALELAIEQAGLRTHIFLHGFVPNDVLDEALKQAHLAVNLRSPTMGEASGSQLRLYATGLPALISQTGWYAEQPESAVIHIQPGAEAAGIVSAVLRVLASPELLPAMASAGLSHLRQRHHPSAYVAQLAEFMTQCARSGPGYRLARTYVRRAAIANTALQLPVTSRMTQVLANLAGELVDPHTIDQALSRASVLACAAASNAPYQGKTMNTNEIPVRNKALGEAALRNTACTTDLAALALRAKPRTELPARLESGLLGKLRIAPWVLRVWNFVSRDWRGPTELTHRILAVHDPVIADMQDIKAQMAQLRSETRQQVMMVRAELVAAEELIAQLGARSQASAQPDPAAPVAANSARGEQFFLQAVADHFRGDPVVLAQRLAAHLPAVAAAIHRVLGAESSGSGAADVQITPLVDLGCGRGEWLELLRDAGHSALGIDMSPNCIVACQDKGLNAVMGDALRMLQQMPDQSVAVVTAFHLVEHLPLAGQITLFNEVWRVLATGGLFLAETPNPENLVVISRNFWYDPTHQRPVPAEMLRLFACSAGFNDVQTEFLQPPPVPQLELDHYPPRVRHMLFCGEDTVLRAFKTNTGGSASPSIE